MTNTPVEIASVESPELFLFGDIEVKSASDGRMRMAGFVSTPRVDLAKEIVDVDAFEEYMPYYKRNPIYCYNHDKSLPIGRVENPMIVRDGMKTGLYLDDITLSAIPVVKEVIWPLVTDRVLTQQSIGFLSIKGAYSGQVYHHQKVYMLESSLVPIACNPDATIDTIKSMFGALPPGYERFETLSDLIGAYDKGLLRLPSDVRRVFAMPSAGESTMLDNTKSEATTPDFADAVVLPVQADAYDPDGVERAKPHKNEKGYAAVCDTIHAAKSETRGSYMFQIAVPTEKGYRYDWKHLAMSMSRVLGGNGGAHFSREQKAAIVDRIANGYMALDKSVPTARFDDVDVPVTNLADDVLETLPYKDVEFRAGEKDLVRLEFLRKDVESVVNALNSYKKEGGEFPADVKDVLKSLYGYVDVSVFTSVNDPDALSFMTALITLINQYVSGEEEDDGESEDEGYMMASPDGMRKFAAYLIAKADAAEKKAAPETVEDQPAVDPAILLPAESLKAFFAELGKMTDFVI